jgi:hypothetical protein
MPATVLQFVFRPNPGADLKEIIQTVKEATALWKKHGASSTSLYAVQLGEIGNMSVVVRFESAAQAGNTLEHLNSDPEFMAWRAKSLKSGLSNWVRSNQLYEISLA